MSFRPTCGKCGDQAASARVKRCVGCGTLLYDSPPRGKISARDRLGLFVPPETPGAVAEPPREVRATKEITEDRQYGCVVSFENADGRTLVLHRRGERKGEAIAGLREACEAALALDPSFRVVAYSTAQTVLSDVRGRADRYTGQRTGSRKLPEAIALGAAGMPEMLHPRLR